MGTRETDQPPLWIATSDLPTSPGHPFYARLTTLLDGHHFDRFVEGLWDRFYAPVMGRPSLAPGRYFRLLLVGYFEGIDSERGMAWRATDSLAVRSFLRLAVDEAPPDHSTIARTRRLIDLETHRTVFTWVQQRLVEAGRLTGKTIAIDATTLEANAAMRSIVRRDTGESYQAFLAGLATASGVETPTREGLARLDRKRKKKTSNTDWTNPHDPDAKVTKMKDGRTHLAHKAEHAVDMETGAIVAVTLQGADVGDTTTIIETAIAAAEQVEDAQANVDDRQSLEEIVGDKGYHSNQTLIDLDAVGIRSYVSEPDRGRRDWSKDPEARAPVYGNRRRMRGRRGRRLMRQRGERIERSFAHLYDTGGMRRTHLRGHTNILKRLLIHAGGFNLGLVMRHLIGIGTPRGLQGRVAAVLATLGVLMGVVRRRLTTISSSHRLIPAVRGRLASLATFAVNSSAAITCTTGCYGFEAWKRLKTIGVDTQHAAMLNNRCLGESVLGYFRRLGVARACVGHLHYRSGLEHSFGGVPVHTLCSSTKESVDAGHYMYQELVVERLEPGGAGFEEGLPREEAVPCVAEIAEGGVTLHPLSE